MSERSKAIEEFVEEGNWTFTPLVPPTEEDPKKHPVWTALQNAAIALLNLPMMSGSRAVYLPDALKKVMS